MQARHQNALHEYSLKGRWPEERYSALQAAISDLLALLAQLRHVYLQLDRPWRKALLERTRFSDLRFLGDVLAVLSMCSTALQSATALPQITPSPLVERFVSAAPLVRRDLALTPCSEEGNTKESNSPIPRIQRYQLWSQSKVRHPCHCLMRRSLI